MQAFPHSIRRTAQRTQWLLLLLVLLRAWVPSGYMPAGAGALRLCSADLPRALRMLAAPAMPGHAAAGEDCPFGHAPVAGPLPTPATPAGTPAATAWLAPSFESSPFPVGVATGHQARAPPAHA